MEQRKPFKQILSEVIGRKKGSEREIEYADETQRISANDVYLKFKNSFSHEVHNQREMVESYLSHSE